MKPSLAEIAVILSVVALGISVSQPIYSFLTTQISSKESTMSNKPSFDMPVSQYHGNVILGPITTSFVIKNNGSGPAHDVDVKVYFNAHSYDVYLEQYLSEIEQGASRTVYFPIGYRQLELAWGTIGETWGGSKNYTITVWIDCREVPSAQQFEFIMH